MPWTRFEAAGSLREDYLAVDWASTPLGAVEGWTPALLGALDLALGTRFAVTLLWGPELVLLYNEAYAPIAGDKHPWSLGRPCREVFPEAWEMIGPPLDRVLAGGEPAWFENAAVPLRRRGFLEELFFTFSYSAVRGADGRVEGVVDVVHDVTREVQDRRRLELLGRLTAALADLDDGCALQEVALPVLRAATADVAAAVLRGTGCPDDEPGLPAGPRTPLDGQVLVEDTAAGRVAWVPLGPDAGRPVLGVLVPDMLAADGPYLDLLRLVGATLTQAVERADARTAERTAESAQRSLSEALQRSLLSPPPEVPGLRVAVRYLPAVQQVQVGGDWYDAFALPDDGLAVVIGDVAGHDRTAAAGMAQLRSLLRGLAVAQRPSPGGTLAAVDAALRDLRVDAVATALVAHLHPDGTGRRVTWSSAGHPPPVLVHADGRAELLAADPDVLLGLDPDRPRSDHEVDLPTGASLVLYTDGLVERRGAALDAGLDWLTGVLDGQAGRDPEELADLLLHDLADVREDDVALLVLRVEA